jgi:uncharacterized membrane protein YfcA
MPLSYFWLLPPGLAIGTFGTLIGAGGGFILVPILLIVYPEENTELITSISLAVVFFNALSGSWAYSRMKRIDYKSGIVFAIATVPGAILGAVSTAYVSRQLFNLIFGALMIVAAIFLWISAKDDHQSAPSHLPDEKHAVSRRRTVRELIDAQGARYRYAYDPMIGIVLSLFVGFVSSLLGVGGGFIHVPALSRLLNFPVHVATATSHFVLAVMAFTGTLVHIATGNFAQGAARTAFIAAGVVVGAQLGARLSNRVGGKWIIRGLALAMLFVGVRLVLGAF